MQRILIFLCSLAFCHALQAQSILVANNDTAYIYTPLQPVLIDVLYNDEIMLVPSTTYTTIEITELPENGELLYLPDTSDLLFTQALIYFPYGTAGTDHFSYRIVGYDNSGNVTEQGNEANVWIQMAEIPTIDCVDICVYPGDANNDGLVNANDLLFVGIGYGFEGPPRFLLSNIFSPMWASDWPLSIDNLNFRFFDCNGDGTIDTNDASTIEQNYDMTHLASTSIAPLPFPVASGGDMSLSVEIENESVAIGDTVVADLILSNAGSNLSIYGLAFSLFHNAVDSNTARIEFLNSFIGDDSNTLSIQKNRGNGQIEAAITRINHLQASGSGVFAKVSFVMEDIVEGKTFSDALNIGINNIVLLSGDAENIVNYENVALVEDYVDIVSRTNPVPTPAFKLYPNPCNETLYIDLPNNLYTKVELLDMAGKKILSKKIIQGQSFIELDVSLLIPAPYIVNLQRINQPSTCYKITIK